LTFSKNYDIIIIEKNAKKKEVVEWQNDHWSNAEYAKEK
jgi:hypothetical protein